MVSYHALRQAACASIPSLSLMHTEPGGHTLGRLTACQPPEDLPRRAQQAVGACQCVHKQVDAASCPRSTLPAGCWRAVHGKLCIRLSKATAPGRCWRKAWRRRARWGSCWPCAAPSRKAPAGAPSPGPRPCSGLGDRSLCHTGGTPRSHQTLLLLLRAYRRASLRLTHPCDSIQTACSLHLEHMHMWGRLGCRAFRRAQAAHERGGGGGCACGRRGGARITLWQAAVPHCRLPGVHCAPAAAADSARKVACANRARCCDCKSDVPAVHSSSSASICSPRPAPSAPGSLRGRFPVHARRASRWLPRRASRCHCRKPLAGWWRSPCSR